MICIEPIRATQFVRTPWKNGGGTTAEIAVSPLGAGYDSFEWRFSMAEVASDGPFSIFPGIERTLVLVDGPGFALTVAGRPHQLDAADPMLSFSGDEPASGRLVAGPVRDFNVMTRRGRATHRVWLAMAGTIAVQDTTLVLAHRASLEVAVADSHVRLERFDSLLCTGRADLVLSGPAILARVTPV